VERKPPDLTTAWRTYLWITEVRTRYTKELFCDEKFHWSRAKIYCAIEIVLDGHFDHTQFDVDATIDEVGAFKARDDVSGDIRYGFVFAVAPPFPMDDYGATIIVASSNDPNARVAIMQPAYPYPCTLIGQVRSDDVNGLLGRIYVELASYRLATPYWYRAPIDFVASVLSQYSLSSTGEL
jgi:hypothetical protein